MLILLPPSEGKTAPRRGKSLDLAALSAPALTPAREAMLAALESASARPDATAILGLTPGQTDLVERNLALRTAPTARADAVYTGVLYDALSPATLSPAAKRRAQARVAITSSLFGIVRPGDRIPAYRLAGDVTLPGLGGAAGSVAGHWRSVLDPVVREELGGGLLIDLRSSTYAAFWRPAADLAPRLATVRVLQERDGRRTVVSHFNKATKGRLVRALMEEGATPRTPERLADAWRDLGWHVETEDLGGKACRLDVVVSEV